MGTTDGFVGTTEGFVEHTFTDPIFFSHRRSNSGLHQSETQGYNYLYDQKKCTKVKILWSQNSVVTLLS